MGENFRGQAFEEIGAKLADIIERHGLQAIMGDGGTNGPGALRGQFVEQGLGVLQIGGVKALGEPAVYSDERRVRFVALALFSEQPCEAGSRTQLPGLGPDVFCDCDRFTQIGAGPLQITIPELEFTSQPQCFGTVGQLRRVRLQGFLDGSQGLSR